MAAFVVFLPSQRKWQPYVPSSFSVTLKIERTRFFLHLLLVSSKYWWYFTPVVGKSSRDKYHDWSAGQLWATTYSGCQSIKHVRLTFENAKTEIYVSEIVEPFGVGPVLKNIISIIMLKHNNEFISLYNNPDRSHTSCSVTRHAVTWNPWSWQCFPETEDFKEDKTRKYDRTKYRTVAHNSFSTPKEKFHHLYYSATDVTLMECIRTRI